MVQQKRDKVVEAAFKVMSEKGYEKASIKDIANEAGITPGLIHYYFRNKEEILTELLLASSQQYTRDMQQLQSSVPSDHLAKAALNEPKERVERQPDWYKLRFELFALGLRNPQISDRVNALLENARTGIEQILHKVAGDAGEEADTDSIAAIMLACFDGLALQKLLNPEFDLDRAYLELEKMVRSRYNMTE
ncbi:TetR/AcrR family transcriptional regulator [Paenibacillus lentus]|uniref:TetR/AcrR family transcriptional regulator n=1 Tax=Paenibacillus lentus TaxID=1338368 RepID=A0A3Q8S979_9BACL|nr:TetR/AcrR family transcriptional regulator [Paenibacillus lentus]AZK45379.1 TetR/AcrR family transcriptional regulator [Paenibacillus lentus]